jgi:hypothetical protein
MWAYENCGQKEVDQALVEARATNGINIIGNLMLLPLKAWFDERSKKHIGFKNT